MAPENTPSTATPICDCCDETPAKLRLSLTNLQGKLLDQVYLCKDCYRSEKISDLVETGYLTNPREERLLKTQSYRQKVAEGIAQAIVDYVRD